MRVAVVVLGDVGLSPRMQYHSLSLATEGNEVDVVGFAENTNKQEPTRFWFLQKVWKVICQTFFLFYMLLWGIPRPDYILLQVPPAIPILLVAHIVSWLRWSRLVIDWHNYGHTILAVTKKKHFSVTVYRWFEKIFGRGAHAYFCVSKAMQEDLRDNWGIRASVLYDRPPEVYRRATLQETHEMFSKYDFGEDPAKEKDATAFTKKEGSKITWRQDRPIMLISSTSWTPDENFDLLVDAIDLLDKKIEAEGQKFPDIRLVVTGNKNELTKQYEEDMKRRKLKHVKMFTAFLPYADYSTLLGSADLGLCLHESSSKVDLPMKVVDMFGCELPVCAVDYRALPELVKDKYNGLIFRSSEELANQIFYPEIEVLDNMRQNIRNSEKKRWHESWKVVTTQVFQEFVPVPQFVTWPVFLLLAFYFVRFFISILV